jgi:hypothetical protein
MVNGDALLGTWRMLSWKREIVATGEMIDVYGPDPVGFLNYGADGRFCAIVVNRDRAAPVTSPATDLEKIRLFDTMMAYAGTYTLDEEKAVHHVDACWNQSWTGSDRVRFYRLDGDRLTIRGAKISDPTTGEEVIHRMEFQRIMQEAKQAPPS